MNRPLLETEKNFIKCAVIILIVGIALIVMGKNAIGIFSVAMGIVFGICAVVSILKNRDEEE